MKHSEALIFTRQVKSVFRSCRWLPSCICSHHASAPAGMMLHVLFQQKTLWKQLYFECKILFLWKVCDLFLVLPGWAGLPELWFCSKSYSKSKKSDAEFKHGTERRQMLFSQIELMLNVQPPETQKQHDLKTSNFLHNLSKS